MAFFAFLAKYTGARCGELLGLKYGDFDYDNGLIHIERSVYHVGNRPEIKEPKTAADIRSVPLIEIVERIMPKGKPSYYVFSDDGKIPLTNSRAHDLWESYCKETGVTATAHQWRHLYATVVFDAGIEAKDAQVLLGHAQFSTTMDIYTYVKDQRITKAAKKLNNLIRLAYTDQEDHYLQFSISSLGSDSKFSIDNKQAFTQKIKINGWKGVYFMNDSVNILIFNNVLVN